MTQTRPLKTNLFNRNADLLHGPIFKNLFLFMLPILVSNLFQQLYNTVDTMIVGNVLGDTALAAIGSCGSIYELLVGFGIGIGNGLSIVAARSYGGAGRGSAQKDGGRVAGHRALRKLCDYHGGLFRPAAAFAAAGHPRRDFRGRLPLHHRHRPGRAGDVPL